MFADGLGIVVAGGQSRRMQPYGDKLLLPRELKTANVSADGLDDCKRTTGETVLTHVLNTVTAVVPTVCVAYSNQTYPHQMMPSLQRDVFWILDEAPFGGPLSAVANVFGQRAGWLPEPADEGPSPLPWFLLVAGDLPGLHPEVLTLCVQQLLKSSDDVDAVVLMRNGRLQPLLAVYRTRVAGVFETLASRGEARLMSVLSQLNVTPLDLGDIRPDAPEWWIRPVHTPQDYNAWLAWRDTCEKS